MFRVSTYSRTADFFLHGNPSDPRINSLWDQQTATFNVALSLVDPPGKRAVLQGDNFTIPTIWYPASGINTRKPTIILGNGYDGAQEESYHQMGEAAMERGSNVINYEGPGQPTPRREQNLGFIVEWEKVVTPIVDYLITLPGVDILKRLRWLAFCLANSLHPEQPLSNIDSLLSLPSTGCTTSGACF
jgi:hypothetical protein